MAELSFFSFPTKIWFGAEALGKLPEICGKEKYGKGLIVTDPGFARTPAYKSVVKTFEKASIPFAEYTEVEGNPTEKDVLNGVKAFNDGKCQWILGVGGGSPLDVAKAIRLMATHPGSVFDYDDAIGGYDKITANVPPFVAIPTTAGTGSEVGRSTVITDTRTKTKKIIFSPHLLANWVIADPLLTLDLPAKITAATGMDALTHNVESYLAKGFHPLADGIALEGIRYVAKYLSRAVHSPRDIEARGGMLVASLMGAVAFQKGLGVTHSLAHPLSTLAGMHHGLANGIMLVPAMKFNSDVSRERLTEISHVAHTAQGKTGKASAESAIAWFDDVCRDIGIPRKLPEAGVKESLFAELVDQAVHDTCHLSNPKPVTKRDIESLYRAAF